MATIIVALDVPTGNAALRLVDRIGDAAHYYKVGSQLFTRVGPEIVTALRDRGKRVFLDLKFHDIPYAVAGAVRSAAELGVDMLTVHAVGGTAMMRAARAAAGDNGPLLIGVTVLTSLHATDIEELWDKELRSLRDDVTRLAALARDAGLDGVVASAQETEALKRRCGAGFLVVTPGIRPEGAEAGDQSRTAAPAEASRAGADYLVVGRPIAAAADPSAAAAAMATEIDGAPAAGAT